METYKIDKIDLDNILNSLEDCEQLSRAYLHVLSHTDAPHGSDIVIEKIRIAQGNIEFIKAVMRQQKADK
jgi:hypothetical protein